MWIATSLEEATFLQQAVTSLADSNVLFHCQLRIEVKPLQVTTLWCD